MASFINQRIPFFLLIWDLLKRRSFNHFCKCINAPVVTVLFFFSPVFLSLEIRLIQGRDQTNYPLPHCSSSCNLSVEVSHLCPSFLLLRNVRWSWTTRRVTAATLWTATFSATPATWRTSSRAAPLPSPPPPPINIAIGGGRRLVDRRKNCLGVTDSRSAYVQFLL